MKPVYYPSAEIIARAFCRQLQRYLAPKQFAEVIARNAKEPNKNVCHSHDFCDANVLMDEAFRDVAGFSATDTGGDDIGCMNDKCVDLFNEAWSIAKAANFTMEKLPYRFEFKPAGEKKRLILHVASSRQATEILEAYREIGWTGVPTLRTTAWKNNVVAFF